MGSYPHEAVKVLFSLHIMRWLVYGRPIISFCFSRYVTVLHASDVVFVSRVLWITYVGYTHLEITFAFFEFDELAFRGRIVDFYMLVVIGIATAGKLGIGNANSWHRKATLAVTIRG